MEQELPADIQRKVSQLTRLQRNYCTYRSKGLTMAISAQRAGSSATDKGSLSRVGYQIEQVDGVKEFIEFLKGQRSSNASIDETDLVALLKDVYERSMKDGNFREANKAAELIGKCLGLMTRDVMATTKAIKATDKENVVQSTVDTSPFTEEDDELGSNKTDERMEVLHKMLKDLNK